MKEYKITEPTFMFINSGDIHSIVSDGGCNESAVVFDLKMLSFEYFDAYNTKLSDLLLKEKFNFHLLY